MKLGKTRRIPESKCLGCGIANDAATPVADDHDPNPGSITICLECGYIMAYDDDLKLRELTRDEQIGIAGDERILAIQRVRKMRKTIGIKPKGA